MQCLCINADSPQQPRVIRHIRAKKKGAYFKPYNSKISNNIGGDWSGCNCRKFTLEFSL